MLESQRQSSFGVFRVRTVGALINIDAALTMRYSRPLIKSD